MLNFWQKIPETDFEIPTEISRSIFFAHPVFECYFLTVAAHLLTSLSVLSSAASLSYGAITILFTAPTKHRLTQPDRPWVIKGFILLIMLVGLVCRLVSLATIAEIAPFLTPLAVGTMFLATLLLSADDFQWATLTDGSHILGSIASLFAPCYKRDEMSHFYVKSNLIMVVLNLAWAGILAYLMPFDTKFVNRDLANLPSWKVCFQSSSMPQNETKLFCPASYFEEFGPIENCTEKFSPGFIRFCIEPDFSGLLTIFIAPAFFLCGFTVLVRMFYLDPRNEHYLDRNLWDSICKGNIGKHMTHPTRALKDSEVIKKLLLKAWQSV